MVQLSYDLNLDNFKINDLAMNALEINFHEEPIIKNICDRLYKNALIKPKGCALKTEQGISLTYEELIYLIEAQRKSLVDLGYKKGDQILCLIPLSLEFIITFFALFAENITPVLLDPRLKKSNWKRLVKEANVKSIISTSKLLQLKWIFWWMKKYPLISVNSLFQKNTQRLNIAPSEKNLRTLFTELPRTLEQSSILLTLTSGTTGIPKLVSRNFKTLKHQQTYSCRYLPPLNDEVHLSLYGIATLLDLIRGVKTFLIKNQNPENIYLQITKEKVNRLSLPPGALDKLCQFLEDKNLKLLGIQSLITGGAPIPQWFLQRTMTFFPNATITIVYGSTECEPISFKEIDFSYFEQITFGYNVGKPIKELQLIKKPFCQFNSLIIFEIELKGKNCVPNNHNDTLQTGDLAYENKDGELILVGRKSDQLNFPFFGYLEEQIERISGVRRTACIPNENNEISIYIELHKQNNATFFKNKIKEEIFNIIFNDPYNLRLVPVKIHFINKMPVDVRHQWKIQRKQLITTHTV